MNLRVDVRAALGLLGTVVKYLAVTLLVPLAVAGYYGEDPIPFAVAIIVAIVSGIALEQLDPDPDLGAREGFLMVSLTWIAVALIGAIPYVVAGNGSVAVPVNAFFESMSGFTTTGATVMNDISFDTHSHALLLWRQQTQWLGGMGIVVLAVAILPELSVGGAQLMDAEAPGPGIQKLTPRIAETARALWVAYMGITVLEMMLLYGLHVVGLAPNMSFYNAVAHGFTTMATGGFSPEARSIEAFSSVVQWVIIPFMVAAGTNFALFWHVMNGDPRRLFRDAEFRVYIGVLAVFASIAAGLLFVDPTVFSEAGISPAGNLEQSLRHGTFQVVSIVTTTGYASLDFNGWNSSARFVLLLAMFIGGSAGSTGGSIKIVRWIVILKALRRELFTTVHPEAVRPVRLGGRVIDDRAIRGIFVFTLFYFVTFFVATVVILVDSIHRGLDVSSFEIMSATAATIGNVGPGFGIVGPMNNYEPFSALSKLVMTTLMWIGRLEILPVLVLLTPSYWKT